MGIVELGCHIRSAVNCYILQFLFKISPGNFSFLFYDAYTHTKRLGSYERFEV